MKTPDRFLFFLFILPVVYLMATPLCQASWIEVSGDVFGAWEADTVKVTGDIFIPDGQTLVIDPGVRVEFQGHYQVVVRGTILAEGDDLNRIIFTRSDTTGFADTLTNSGGWGGIFYEHLDPANDSSRFTCCDFRFGKAVTSGDSIGLYGGAFRIVEFSGIVLNRCLLEYNHAYRWGGAIYGRYASIRVHACIFRNNISGRAVQPWGYGGAVCFVHSSPEITRCLFEANQSTGIGGAASFEYSDPVVSHNHFITNKSGLGGGIGYLRSHPEHTCNNNLISGNEAVFFGGGIACIAAHTRFVNNTVTGNSSTYGGGFYCNDSAVPSNYNCLYYNNFAYEGIEVYIWDIRSAPNFYFCNVPGDTAGFAGSGGHEGYHGEYQNNLDTIPGFTGLTPDPFALLASSPLKDAGTPDTSSLGLSGYDLAGNPRIYHNRIDIGTYEWNPGPGISEAHVKPLRIIAYPNPSTGKVTIRFTLHQDEFVELSVVDLSGKPLVSGLQVKAYRGENEVALDQVFPFGQFPSGAYFLFLKSETETGGELISIL